MKKANIIFTIITIIVFISIVLMATFAYFASSASLNNTANLNVATENSNLVFDTIGGNMILNVTAANMTEANAGIVAASNNTTLIVNFTANTPYSMVCSYDIIYEWTSANKYTAHSPGTAEPSDVTSYQNEYAIKAVLNENAHASVGANKINHETDLAYVVGNQTSATVVSGAQIDGTGSTTTTAVWSLSSKFYNLSVDQTALSGKSYSASFKVDNVSCVAGTVQKIGSFDNYWFAITSNNNTFPASSGTVYASGPSTGEIAYIAQDSTKYYVCAYVGEYGKEVCFSQPITQYGLTGHTAGQNLTQSEQESIIAGILQAFNAAGISITSSSCAGYSNVAGCFIYDLNDYISLFCSVDNNLFVGCYDYYSRHDCYITNDGKAGCITY